jgi:DNA-binding beta-propeller fold protein YncE
LYVANYGSGGVAYINEYNGTTGAFISQFVPPKTGPPIIGLNFPEQLRFGPDGNLYVADSGNGQVDQFNGTTAAYADFVPYLPPGGAAPQSIAFGPDGNLYVDDLTDSVVLKFNGTTGAPMGTFVTSSAGLGQPFDLVFGPNGNLYVTDDNGVEEINGTTGAFIANFVPVGTVLEDPNFLAFGPSGTPEPATFFLYGLGLAVLAAGRRFRR